jgi:hypothetical protein
MSAREMMMTLLIENGYSLRPASTVSRNPPMIARVQVATMVQKKTSGDMVGDEME